MSIRGRIEEARQSQSGKTMGVKINGHWYSSKAFELENMVGQTIEGQTSASEWNGKTMMWLNDYKEVPASADDAMQAAMAGPASSAPVQAPQSAPQPAQAPTDKDLTITALAILKAVDGLRTPQAAVQAFREIKQILASPQAQPAPPANPDYDDEIPF